MLSIPPLTGLASVAGIDWVACLRASFFAALMTLGWSLMTNLPRRYLGQCLAISAIGYSIRNLLLQLEVNLIATTFIAATITAFLAVFLARRYLITPKVVLVPALLCMMPGVTAYKAMISLVKLGYYGYQQPLFVEMLNHAFNALFVTGALVFGLSFPSTIFYRRRPIV